ncbi:MLP-like protein 28 [Manihot esculenta]|uniref:Bet v I/Major latex protein domain-containing protein n=1 Tax=Manihot esculenta TaxID=3983 RepID=A0A2C9U645_MANES|nr:MLP-like protein 28 [Manihot esculenta]OAY25252.1 hypothetical protein MANES_17G079100v8 [Manihot esculenta]
MTLWGKLEAQFGIDAPADQFHDVLSCRPHHISNMSHNIHGCDLHEGEWGKEGAIVCWKYFHDGSAKVAKEVIETIDDVNLLIVFKVIEGDLLEEFKNFKVTVQVTPKGEGSVVRWTLEYEKIHENIPDPYSLLEIIVQNSKDVSAHLVKCQNK